VSQLFGPIGHIFQIIITQPIFNVLMLLYDLFGTMALSIIVLTLIVRLALFPLTLETAQIDEGNPGYSTVNC
jgi:YidC/Oxa1 family membrane protein insertase